MGVVRFFFRRSLGGVFSEWEIMNVDGEELLLGEVSVMEGLSHFLGRAGDERFAIFILKYDSNGR